MSADQSHLALQLLQTFLNRASAEHHGDRSLILDLMRSIRQRQAAIEFEEMELAHGKVREPGAIKDEEIPF